MFNLWNYLNTYSKFGKKMSSGEWFHDQQRVFVGASDMVCVSACRTSRGMNGHLTYLITLQCQ